MDNKNNLSLIHILIVGLVALVLATVALFFATGPLGMDGQINESELKHNANHTVVPEYGPTIEVPLAFQAVLVVVILLLVIKLQMTDPNNGDNE